MDDKIEKSGNEKEVLEQLGGALSLDIDIVDAYILADWKPNSMSISWLFLLPRSDFYYKYVFLDFVVS